MVDGTAANVDVLPSRHAEVGGHQVRRALPQRTRRTVGAWCFADHVGPIPTDGDPLGIGPHPHTGLQTVTWLIEGELLHRDSLGSEQTIQPGQLNLMTAGRGVSHAEEPTDQHRSALHGIQLWVAQPEATRHGGAAFEHHAALPQTGFGSALATVLVGELGGTGSPARTDTPLVGADLRLRPGSAELPLDATFEHALVVLEGSVGVTGQMVVPGNVAYLGIGRPEVVLTSPDGARLLLLGGVPFESPVVMWWNFVGRSRREMVEATEDWNAGEERFGVTGSPLARIPAPSPPWADHPET